jgi:hypothetical protein
LSFRQSWNFLKAALWSVLRPWPAEAPALLALLASDELPQAARAIEAPATARTDRGVLRRDMGWQ